MKLIINIKKNSRTLQKCVNGCFSFLKRVIFIIYRPIKRNYRVVLLSEICAILLLLISYGLDSTLYSFGGELKVGQWIEPIKHLLSDDSSIESVPDSVLLINTSYDKTLLNYEALLDASDTECYYRQHVGRSVVTDRAKLLTLLTALDTTAYRYIMMDIRFEKGFEKDSVSMALLNKLSEMDNIVVAKHSNYELADTIFKHQTAIGDYYTTFLDAGLVKYPTLVRGENTIPGKIYEERCGGDLKKRVLWYTDRGRLCYGSVFLTFPFKVTKWQQKVRQGDAVYYYPLYYNLGTDILEANVDIKALFSDKIIVIGDFVEDIHETYVGRLPGAIINLNAYAALSEQKHLVNWYGVAIIFCIYTAVCLGIFKRKSLFDYISIVKRSNSRILRFVLSFIGYSVLLATISISYYILCARFYSIIFPAFYFSILSAIVRYYHMKVRL